MNRYSIAGVAAAAILTLTAGSAGPAAADEPVDAVTTVGMLADVVATVGGDCADVTAIMGPGIDPHLYQASAGDVRTFQRADIIFYSGLHLEGQLGDVLGRFAQMKPTVAVAETSIDPDELIRVAVFHGGDPHVWMDVSLWARTIPTVAAALSELRPDCAANFEANAAAYGEVLAAFHPWVAAAIATIPEQQRILVTAHDAFNYYGRAYGIEVAGIQGISTESEAGVADIRHMADIVAERQVPALFVESTINPRTIQAVIDAVRERGHEVTIGGQLYSDAMGETGTADGTYIGMIYANTTTITEALGGTPPPLPAALGPWAEHWGIEAEVAAD